MRNGFSWLLRVVSSHVLILSPLSRLLLSLHFFDPLLSHIAAFGTGRDRARQVRFSVTVSPVAKLRRFAVGTYGKAPSAALLGPSKEKVNKSALMQPKM